MMKPLFSLILLEAVFATVALAAPNPDFYVFLCFGQSNMDGAGRIEAQDNVVNSRFQVLAAMDMPNLGRRKGNWYPAVPPLCRPQGGLGPADYFGRTLAANLPDHIRVGIINVSIPGCKIELFEKDTFRSYAATVPDWMSNFINEYEGNPFQTLVDLAKLAQHDGVIKGVLLHQGESNTGDLEWPNKVKGVYENLLRELDLAAEEVPLLAGETVHADQDGVCAEMNKLISSLPETVPTAHVISSAGVPHKGDRLHFSAAGNRELGRRFAETMVDLVRTQTEAAAGGLEHIPQQAAFDYFEYEGVDRMATTPLADGEYRNPILAGFHPDPSICRAGEDYYLINSTFEYFPGLPIFHSKDLVNWSQIGHVIHRAEQLDFRGRRVSMGLFAPAISYHDGLFYVVCTKIDGPGNFVVTAQNPVGPWSDPTPIRFGGIDPSIFFDDDGRAWIVGNDAPDGPPKYNGHRAIWIQEFDWRALQMIGPRSMLVDGGIDISKKPVWIEGPHIYKLRSYYYLCCAEGGTGPQHSQVILRSKQVEGPYYPWGKNPILTQRDLREDVPGAVTCTGHADLVVGPDGSWWAVFLAVRPYEQGRSPMGRETFLLPVTWTEDDWPLILPAGKRVPLVASTPDGVSTQSSVENPLNGSFSWRDDFTQEDLSLEWIMVREPEVKWWHVDPSKGTLQLQPREDRLDGNGGNPTYLGRRVRHDTYKATLALEVPKREGVSAGLALFLNERHHYFLAVQRRDSHARLTLERVQRHDRHQVAEIDQLSLGDIELRVSAQKGLCSFLYRQADADWQTLAADEDATIISFTVPDGMFLGATAGPHVRLEP